MEPGLESTHNGNGIRVYKYRWMVLFLFCLSTVTNFMQFLQFTIIANIITKYYDVENFAVDATGLVFFLAYIILFLPVSYLIERYDLKITLIISTGLTLIGTLIKLGCAHPGRFYVVLLGQIPCAVGQIYLLSTPSKIASLWFGPNEVSTACALAVLGTQFGAALGALIPPFLVKTDDDTEVGDNLFKMMVINAIISCVVFILVVIFFRPKPKLPPSQSQRRLLEVREEHPSFLENCKGLMKNRNFLLLLFTFGLFNSIWNAFGIIINTIFIHYFPDGENDIGIITLSAIISGGCIGSVVFGLVLDKTHQFKKTSIGIMVLSTLLYVVVIYTLMEKSLVGAYIAIPVFGFFAASGLIVSFEYTLEETYPVPESVSCSLMNATIFFFAIVVALIAEGLIKGVGYLYTFICTPVMYLVCIVVLIFAKTNLRRREANLGIS